MKIENKTIDIAKSETEKTEETPKQKIERLEKELLDTKSEVEKSRELIVSEMTARATRCSDEVNAVLAKHKCSIVKSGGISAYPLS